MRDELRELVERLVAIDSVNPTLVPGGAGEAGSAASSPAGSTRAASRPSTTSRRLARERRRSRVAAAERTVTLLNAHMDTVALGGADAGLSPRVDGNRLYGRGAYDMKASLAAIMLVGAAARRDSSSRAT